MLYNIIELMNPMNSLTIAQLKRAIAVKERLLALETELASILGSESRGTVAAPSGARGGISAAGRARIAAAQRARWARVKAGKSRMPAMPARPKKFTMSAAAKAAISRAAKARWAKIKSARM
jgi:hypothetical protein